MSGSSAAQQQQGEVAVAPHHLMLQPLKEISEEVPPVSSSGTNSISLDAVSPAAMGGTPVIWKTGMIGSDAVREYVFATPIWSLAGVFTHPPVAAK
jgi:hypothetical protein